MKTIMIILSVLLVFIGIVYASDYQVDEDMDLIGNNIYNATNINATNLYQDGVKVLDEDNINDTFFNYTNYANESVYWDGEISQADLNVNSSNYWDSYDIATDLNDRLTLNWANITSKFITAVDNIYIYMSGTTATFNETKLNETIIAIDTATNDTMKSYVDGQDVVFNDSMKSYVDSTFITQANESNLNVNSSNSSDYWDDIDTPDDFTNIIASGNITAEYLFGQPIVGSIGSGLINCSDNLDHCGCSNITKNSGLEIHYPEFEIRIVKTDGTETHCHIDEGDINVTDNQHSTYYLNSSCEWNYDTFNNFHNADMSPGGRARVFDVLAINGIIEETKGNTLLYLAKDKLEQVRILCPSASHLTVCNGFDITVDTFLSFNVSSGNSVYLNTYLPTNAKSTLEDETHLTHHEAGSWVHTNVTGFNITHCDNGTDLVECTGTVYRQYPVYSLSWDSDAKIHMLSPLTTGNTYPSLSACKEATPDYVLPAMEEYVAIVHHIYCARRTDSVWDSDAWVDLRTAPVGAGGSPDLSIYLVEDGTRPLTNNWDVGNYNITAQEFIADTWSDVSITESQISDFESYRLDSWDNFTGIPHATPSNGDVTHFSLADEIYDWVISLGYSTTTGTVTSVATTSPLSGGTITTSGTLSITNDGIGDTQLEYNTGQHLTTTSDPTFNNMTVETVIFEVDPTNHKIFDNATCIIIKAGSTTLNICE